VCIPALIACVAMDSASPKTLLQWQYLISV
jgi:hypothetical protein